MSFGEGEKVAVGWGRLFNDFGLNEVVGVTVRRRKVSIIVCWRC